MNLKRPQIRSKKYRDAARGQSCKICQIHDDTIVPAHYSGIHSNKLGKGAGVKSWDIAVADLCVRCHAEMDSYKHGKGNRGGAKFLDAILATQIRRENQGLLFRSSGKGLHEELPDWVPFELWELLDVYEDEAHGKLFEALMAFCELQIEQVYSGELVVKGMK